MKVVGVSQRAGHHFSKTPALSVELVAGHGVLGDGHYGTTVQHRSRVARNPDQPNLRQVHLMHVELFAELAEQGFSVAPSQLGENITTEGIELLRLSCGQRLRLGDEAVVELTGLRNPCGQLNGHADGLMNALRRSRADGSVERLAGVMAIVVQGGVVTPQDPVTLLPLEGSHRPLEPV